MSSIAGMQGLKRLGLLPAAAALLTLAGWLALEDSARGAPNSVRVEPSSAVVAPGESVTVSVIVEAPAAGLAAWEVDLLYDGALLRAAACSGHPEGACDSSFAPGIVGIGGQAADVLTDQFSIGEVTFETIGGPDTCSVLEIQVLTFADADDLETAPAVSHGEVCIQGPAPTPTPTPGLPPCPRYAEFDAGEFSEPPAVDNPLLPLVPGKQAVFEGVSSGLPRRVVATVTDVTKAINGVKAVVVWEQDFSNGVLLQEKLAFFAQDGSGNVWNLGEYLEEHVDGVFIGATNTWIAGLAQAEGGVQMPGEPRLNEPPHLLGWAPDIDFLACGRVVADDASVCVPVSCYDDVTLTRESDPSDSSAGARLKYHAGGVGVIQITSEEDPEAEVVSLEEHRDLGSAEMAEARAAALALDERGYENSEVYAQTEPAEAPADEPTPAPSPTPGGSPEPTPDETPEPTPEGTPEPTPAETPEPTPEPNEEPEPTPQATPLGGTGGGASPTPATAPLAPRPSPTVQAPRPSRTPVALGARRAPRAPLRTVRGLPSTGGSGLGGGGPVAVSWVIPASGGLLLLGAYVYGSARRSASRRMAQQAIDSVTEAAADVMFERLQALKHDRRPGSQQTEPGSATGTADAGATAQTNRTTVREGPGTRKRRSPPGGGGT